MQNFQAHHGLGLSSHFHPTNAGCRAYEFALAPPGIELSIRLLTLGPPQCVADGRLTDLSARKHRFALLVYLALHRRATRGEAAAILWLDRQESRARQTLAHTLHELRRDLGTDWLVEYADVLEVSPRVSIDAREFDDLIRARLFSQAVAMYRGDFLAGFHTSVSPEFDAWVEAKRRDYKRLFDHAMGVVIAELSAAKNWHAALEHASHWVEIHPLEDEANHVLIEILAASGERADALAHFASYERRLREQLGVRPLDKTVDLIEQIRSGDEASPPSPAATPAKGHGLLAELTRRRVLRMAGWYAASLFVVLQSVQALQQALYLPSWVLTATALLGLFGFPVALLLSWQFDLTPEGVMRTEAGEEKGGRILGRGDWRVVTISMTLIIASTVAAFSTSTVRGLLAVNRAPTLLCPNGSPAPCRNAIPIAPNRYAVLPLSHQSTAKPSALTGDIYARLLGEGVSYWRDINVADLRLYEALQRLAPSVRARIPVDTGIAVAREVGAGKLIMGEVWQYDDSTRVRVFLYDVITGRQLNATQGRFRNEAEAASALYELAQRLVVESEVKVSVPVAAATTSFAALIAYDSAWNAISQWDLARARTYFNAALGQDPQYSYAHLWLAHVMLWQGDSARSWRFHAERAQAERARLGVTEQLLARGIAALSAKQLAEACRSYRELLARDSASFHAWYGLSECLARDNYVVRDTASPSGWSFESSFEEAIRAHQRALLLVPSFNQAFINLGSSRLASLLFLSPAKYRSGVARYSRNSRFAARPELLGDTISFVPYPHAEWTKQRVAPANAAVIARQRVVLRQAATDWATAFPNNTRALEALAGALEQSGEIAKSVSAKNTGLDVVRRARLLERDPEQEVRLSTSEIRMLFKVGRFKDARALALSTLKKHTATKPEIAERLAGVAGLVGKPHTMAGLLVVAAQEFDYDRPPSGEDVEVPPELAATTAALLGYAYFGGPLDSVRMLLRRSHATLERTVAPERRALVHAATLDRAARVLFPILGPDEIHRSDAPLPVFLRMQRLLWRGDTAAVVASLAALEELQKTMRLTDAAADGVLTQAQLYLAVGDTAHATRMLDAYLNDLQSVPPTNFRQPYQPIAIVHMMQLRAELAARTGHRTVARKWARAVVDLWDKGDREVKPVLRRMRPLARLR